MILWTMKMLSFALQTDSFCGNENEACTRGCVRTADVGKRMAAPAAAILAWVARITRPHASAWQLWAGAKRSGTIRADHVLFCCNIPPPQLVLIGPRTLWPWL